MRPGAGGGGGGGCGEYAELADYGAGSAAGGGRRRAAADDDPRAGLYYSPPGTSYTIVERPASALTSHRPARHHRDRGHYDSPASPRGTYLGSTPNFHTPTPRSASASTSTKKRPISPEQVLRLFGGPSPPGGGAAAAAGPARGRRSPAASPPSAAHHRQGAAGGGGGRPPPPPPPPLSPPPPHRDQLVTRTVTMVRDPQDASATHGFGICVKGGKEAGVGVYISRVEEGSVAERSGLRPGDSILEVNGTPFTGITHEEALKMLKSCRKLSMTVRSPAGSWAGGRWGGCGGPPPRQTCCSWMDRHGRPASPPPEYAAAARYGANGGGGGGRAGKDRLVRRVDLCIEPGQSLGLMIRGGVEYNLGIFITGVDKDSVADRAGLMVGDQILEVNGQSFMDVTHDEAVATLKYHKRMSLVVRDVGKVPHSCTAYDREWDLCSPGSRVGGPPPPGGPRRWAAAMQMVEEKARRLLARPDFGALAHYTDGYATGRVSVDGFVRAVRELLDTPDKYTLMTELREIVAIEDRARFDELVYGRDLESQRIRDPREHDYRHSRRKGIPIPGSNHTGYSGYSEDYGPVDFPPGWIYNEEGAYRSPSEDSGLGMGIADKNPRIRPPSSAGKTLTDLNDEDHHNQEYASGDEDNPPGNRSRRHSSPDVSRSGSTTALHQQDYPDSELAHKLSRSFDMKDEQGRLEGGEGGLRRHQSMQRLGRAGGGDAGDDREAPRVVQDEEGNLRVTVRKSKPILGIAIEGGANTKHPLPRIININENGAAYSCGGLAVGQLILQVDGRRVAGLQHRDVARLIAERFARTDTDDIEFTVVEAKKSNTEPKPTALIFLEA